MDMLLIIRSRSRSILTSTRPWYRSVMTTNSTRNHEQIRDRSSSSPTNGGSTTVDLTPIFLVSRSGPCTRTRFLCFWNVATSLGRRRTRRKTTQGCTSVRTTWWISYWCGRSTFLICQSSGRSNVELLVWGPCGRTMTGSLTTQNFLSRTSGPLPLRRRKEKVVGTGLVSSTKRSIRDLATTALNSSLSRLSRKGSPTTCGSTHMELQRRTNLGSMPVIKKLRYTLAGSSSRKISTRPGKTSLKAVISLIKTSGRYS